MLFDSATTVAYLPPVTHKEQTVSSPQLNIGALNKYLIAAGIAVVIGLGLLALRLPAPLVLMAAAAPFAVLAVTIPRLAVYQFVFLLFVEIQALPSVSLLLIDVSAMLVITAAILDVLASTRLPRRFPPMTLNWTFIIVVMIVCGIFGYRPELAIRPLIRITLLMLTFGALYRLSAKVPVSELVRLFFWLAVFNSIYSLVPFVLSGGVVRSFGFTAVVFDDLSMVAVPIGLSLYLGARTRQAWCYLIGVALTFAALVATQSRAPIIFAVVACGVVLVTAYRRTRHSEKDDSLAPRVSRRIRMLLISAILLLPVVVVTQFGLLSGVLDRFSELLNPTPVGSTIYRMVLWTTAVTTFFDHPVLGIGPGGFVHLREFAPTMRIVKDYMLVAHLSAHNIFLHYLAEMGIFGGAGLVALFSRQLVLTRRSLHRADEQSYTISLALFSWAFLYALTTMIEGGWMWGQISFVSVFLIAMVARRADTPHGPHSPLSHIERT